MTAVEDGVLGRIEFLADADRPGGWLLTVDRIRQSYVDLDDPTYLDFEYVRVFGDVVDLLPTGPLTVTHVGGGACTLVRYVAHTRPGSRQIVLEPDEALITQVRARLPFGRGVRVRIRPVDGRTGITALGDASADLVVLDAFHGGRVPYELTSREFVTEAARVLRPDGVLLVNIADGPPMWFTRRLVNTIRTELPELLAVADPSVLKGRRFGNVVLVASPSALPADELRRVAARAPFPRIVHGGAQLVQFAGGAPELSDTDPMRSPEPPDALWRVGEGDWD